MPHYLRNGVFLGDITHVLAFDPNFQRDIQALRLKTCENLKYQLNQGDLLGISLTTQLCGEYEKITVWGSL